LIDRNRISETATFDQRFAEDDAVAIGKSNSAGRGGPQTVRQSNQPQPKRDR
jgi:hypothetical protein